MLLLVVSALAEFQEVIAKRFGKPIDYELLIAFSKMMQSIVQAIVNPPKIED